MDQISFDSTFSNLSGKVGKNGPRYEDKILENAKTKQVDELITAFADLYINGNRDQKRKIFDFFADKKIRFDFWLYIQRVALLINSIEDDYWLQRGLAAAVLDGGRGEWKELHISLPLLRHGAERVGIDARPYFDNVLGLANEVIKPSLMHAFDEDKYRFAIQMSGPDKWVSEIIEKYGEHPLYTEMQRKIEEQERKENRLAKLRKITILSILGVGALAIIGLIISYFLQAH